MHGLLERLARRHERRMRDRFAEALERDLDEVDRPWRRGGSAFAIDRSAVAEAAPLLLDVVVRLRAPEPFPREAMRHVRWLLGDGAGPLYSRSAHRSEYPGGTLARVAGLILAACEDRSPRREPARFARS